MPSAAWAGPNLVAVANYDEIPFTRAEARVSHAGKEAVFSFSDPKLDFGRVVVRSNQPLSVVKRDLFVGYTGNGLVVDTRTGGGGGGGSLQIQQLEIWLRLNGALRGGRSYAWEIQVFSEREIDRGVPAVIPMFWADGEQYGSEVTIAEPEPEDTDRIQRLLLPHGVVDLPEFERQTGTAWIVLKPEAFGQGVRIASASFREIEKTTSGSASEMPVPVRYTPIRSVVEDQVAEAFDRGVEALKNQQTPDGFWAAGGGENDIRATANIAGTLSVFDRNLEGLKRAYEWLANRAPQEGQNFAVSTVAVRLGCLAISGRAKDYDATIRRDVVFLTEAQLQDGGWGERSAAESTGAGSLRSTHETTTTVLSALSDARLAGVDPEAKVWKNALQYWTAAQTYGGGFSDRTPQFGGVGQPATNAYTAIGAANLLQCIDMAFAVGGKRCSGYTSANHQLRALDSALAWLEKRYGAENQFSQGVLAVQADPRLEPLGLIFLGAVTGLPTLNEKNYFRESASSLLRHFDSTTAMFGVRGPNNAFAVAPSAEATAVSLSALALGNAPVVCQRLIVGDDNKGWAQYRSDVAHLARYFGQKRGAQFNWRRTGIEREIRELAEVPILVLSAVGPFEWTKEHWAKLRDYCLSGGSVVVDVAPEAESHRESIEKAVREAFPEYELGDLPPDAAVLNAGQRKLVFKGLKALGNGFRHFLFMPAESWSCHWHLYDITGQADSFAFMDGLLTHATDGSPPRSVFAGSTYAIPSASSKQMTAARLQLGGAVPAYPNLIEGMSRLMQSNYRLAISEAADPASADLVWVNVAGEANKSEKAAEQLLAAARAGKFLLVDVVTGNPDWHENFQALLKTLDDKFALERLPRSSPIFTGMIPGTQGFDVVEAPMRKALHTRFSKTGRCDLYAIVLEGKPVGVFSAHDLSSGVGFHQFPGCRGPMPEEARKIAMNAFLAGFASSLGSAVH